VRYDLKDLRLFKAILEARNLSVGAGVMHMTASSASYRLKNLEYAAGSPLFRRTSKGMVLTPAGEVLARHANKLLADVELMHAELSDYSKNLKGSIRLLANSSSLNGFIIPSLARFLAANSSINVDLKEKDSPSIVTGIEDSDADIGIVAGEVSSPSLEVHLYAIDRLICAVAVDHPLAGVKSVSFEQLLEHDFVCMDRSSSNFVFLSNQARSAGKALNARVHVQDFNSVLYLVQAQVGVALVPASVAEKHIIEKRVCGIAIDEAWSVRNLHLVIKHESAKIDLVREFADILLNDPQVVAARHKGS
jgi:DNA-binding transcriptional LysR family regulator